MKKHLILIALTALAASCVFAQPKRDHDHDHSKHDHSKDDHSKNGHKADPKKESALDYFWRKSDEAFHDGDYERAIGLHKAIVALDRHDVESYSVAAWLMWSLGKKEDAISHIERGLKNNEKDWAMWDEAAKHYKLQAGRETESPLLVKVKDAFLRATQLAPAGADTQMLRRSLAHAAEKSGDLDLSVATWRKLVEDFPDEVINKNNLARVEAKIAEGKRAAIMPFAASGVAMLAMIGTGAALRKRAALR